MRHLMMTTAIATAATLGTALAAAADSHVAAPDTANMGTPPAFLASDFTGMAVFATDTPMTAGSEADAMSIAADRGVWENAGTVGDIVISRDGEVRGIVIDVGGFLGFGAHTVMIDMADIHLVPDASAPAGIDDFIVVTALTRDELEALPEWSDDMLQLGLAPGAPLPVTDPAPVQQAAPTTDGTMPPAPTEAEGLSTAATDGRVGVPGAPASAPDGYAHVALDEASVAQLQSAPVFDALGEEVGRVDDMVLRDDDRVAEFLVDVGGFLGIGSHTVELPATDADLLWNAEADSLRIHLPMTREQLESLPEYAG